MAEERGQPHRAFVAEGDGQGVLQMGASRHRRVAIAPSELGEMAANRGQVFFDQPESCADLQHDSRIHDVLGRGSPMDVTAVVSCPFGELANERQDRVSDSLGFLLQSREIECLASVR